LLEHTRLDRRLGKMTPRALRLRTVRGALDSEVLFATGVATYRDRARAPRGGSDHLHRDAFGSFLYRSEVELDQPAFEHVLERLPDDVIRAKGIVRLAGRDWHCLFNVTCGRAELGWLKLPDERTDNQAVFIGRNLDRHRAGILEALRRCERAAQSRQGEIL
jgi:G3E family GTPase